MDNSLENQARRVRQRVLELSCKAKSAHAGSSLSVVEILTTVFSCKYSPGSNVAVDHIVLSKGHAAMALYATANIFRQLEDRWLEDYLQDGSGLWGHPSQSAQFPFIHWSTGSLGHGLPVLTGRAFSHKQIRQDNSRTLQVAVLSDGECDEGSNWEAALFAGHHQLDNLMVIVDYNKIQSFGRCEDVADLEPFAAKWQAFKWSVVEVDGHNCEELLRALQNRKPGQPTCVIAHTVKGKGVPEIEDTVQSHYKPISENQLKAFCEK